MKPIIFSGEMVRAILDGRKTQTRRVIKPQPEMHKELNNLVEEYFWHWKDCQWIDGGIGMSESAVEDYARYKRGDILWVRETWRLVDFEHIDGDWNSSVQFKDGTIGLRLHYLKNGADERIGWRPSIHMPRAAARLFLRVTDVRAERLQEINGKDVMAEGIHTDCWNGEYERWEIQQRKAYRELWDSLNAKKLGCSWGDNPYVWVYSFEKLEGKP